MQIVFRGVEPFSKSATTKLTATFGVRCKTLYKFYKTHDLFKIGGSKPPLNWYCGIRLMLHTR